jgi:Holliday junction DNA helicase RuvA
LLLTVTGVGPKAALAMLSALGGVGLARAVAEDDLRSLTKVPGIGAKTGQRLILELKDKLAALGWSQRPGTKEPSSKPAPKPATVLDDVVSALVNLGYNRTEAVKAADAASGEAGATPDFPALLRASLQRLTR